MRLYQAGEKSIGICESCRTKVSTRMEYRDYKPTGWDVSVPDVLVATCELCDRVVAVPHQSTPKINEFRKDKTTNKGIEVRVPRAIEDALDLISASLGVDRKFVRPAILRFYLNLLAQDPAIAKEVQQRSKAKLATGPAKGRISMRVPERQWNPAWSAAKAAGITNIGQLFRGLAILALEDFNVQIVNLDVKSIPRNPKAAKARSSLLKTMAKTFSS